MAPEQRTDAAPVVRPPAVGHGGSIEMTLSPPVVEAIAGGRPVVALESTIISHGLPRPQNLEAAHHFEQVLRDQGVTPATIAVLDGQLHIGLDDDALKRVATDDITKASVRDLPMLIATGGSGATTVAATAHLARLAGIRVIATGGLGGVHRLASSTYDESADLMTLAQTPITVVSAGVKSILDIGATLERLETLGVTVLGYRTSRFPAFWLTDSGHDLDWRVESGHQVVEVMAAGDALTRTQAVLVANPLAIDQQLDPEVHDSALDAALAAACDQGVRGKQVTPFLLSEMVQATGGRSLDVNLQIVRNNVALAGEIARAWAEREQHMQDT
ncbi:pseudouridine-5'-phosphate glycosidase [soil metagenome]